MDRIVPKFAILVASFAVISSCAGDEMQERPVDAGDASIGEPDAGADDVATADDGNPPDFDTLPPVREQSFSPSAGGATLETGEHRIRLIVGPRGGSETIETSNHRIQMGAGSAQHAQ